MADRVCVYPPAAGVGVQQCRAEFQDLGVGLVEVGDVEVQVELLRVRAVWPLRCPEVRDALEREHEAGAGVQG
jgi:hypothetical protein